MSNEFNDDLTLDPKQESLLETFLHWGMRVKAKEGDGELSFKAMGVSVEPPNKIIGSSIVNFVLSSVQVEDEDLESELLSEASNEFPVPVDSLKESADQTATKLVEGSELFEELEFIPFKTKDDLFAWATDSKAEAEAIYMDASDEEE